MITAKEAREIATPKSVLEQVLNSIRECAKRGEMSLNLPDECLSEQETRTLRSLGYTVTVSTEYHEGIAQTYTKIAW